MPNFDGTGPNGEGQMTGGGRGFCVKTLKEEKDMAIKRGGGGKGRKTGGGGRGGRGSCGGTRKYDGGGPRRGR